MLRIAHGSNSPPELAAAAAAVTAEELGHSIISEATAPAQPDDIRHGYLFDDLAANPDALLPESPATLEFLNRLGAEMFEPGSEPKFDSRIPAVYTYLGQFIAHDITFTDWRNVSQGMPTSCMLGHSLLRPLPKAFIKDNLPNQRSSIMELDCVYGEIDTDTFPPRDDDDERLLLLGKVTPHPRKIKGKDDFNDVPRWDVPPGHENYRIAMIGDLRNDQNLIISQLHVAFLHAHNAIIKKKNCSFDEAQKLLRQHYHWLIIHDYLKQQIADEATVNRVLSSQQPLYDPRNSGKFFLPLEFTVAAFRFGHSMIRSFYYLNSEYPSSLLDSLLTLTVLSKGQPLVHGSGTPTLSADRIIDWTEFRRENMARRLDTRMVDLMKNVRNERDEPVPCERRLTVHDLKRGYMLRIPTGQAIAHALDIAPLTEQQMRETLKDNQTQLDILSEANFLERTPLWFYILVEAMHSKAERIAKNMQGNADRLGPVGSRLVAEVLIGLVRCSKDSILDPNTPGSGGVKPWTPDPDLGHVKGQFNLPALLNLAETEN